MAVLTNSSSRKIREDYYLARVKGLRTAKGLIYTYYDPLSYLSVRFFVVFLYILTYPQKCLLFVVTYFVVELRSLQRKSSSGYPKVYGNNSL